MYVCMSSFLVSVSCDSEAETSRFLLSNAQYAIFITGVYKLCWMVNVCLLARSLINICIG